jgi:hypothetical protein
MRRTYSSSAVVLTAPKDKFGPAVIGDLEIGRFDEIEVVAIPRIGLDNPLSANEFTGGRAGHGTAAISLGLAPGCRRPQQR